MTSATDAVSLAYQKLRSLERRDVFITVVEEEKAIEAARTVEARLADGAQLPLAGLVGAVKDNIDIAELPTTAGCPAFSYMPDADATCVRRMVEAGLVLIGKTNLDQFATGLVGTRSPYGKATSVLDHTRVAGGSSSGSALAVALGIVDVALGTDTAGSGRVPASFNGIVGAKPTHGLVPTSGVVPACPTLDCVSVFARDVGTTGRVLAILIGDDGLDPLARQWPLDTPLGLRASPHVAVPDPSSLGPENAPWRQSFDAACGRLRELGARLSTIDVSPLLELGKLLYGGAFVAERYASVGSFIEAHRDEVDPVVGAIVAEARDVPAHRLATDALIAADARRQAKELLAGFDALMMPTVPEHPSLDEVAADPVGTNNRLGVFTTFCNLADLAALSLPSPGDLSPFGVTLFGPAFSDQRLADLGSAMNGETPPTSLGAPRTEIVVVGAHLIGQPLNGELTERGGRLVALTETAPMYRLFALPTTLPKPGLVFAPDDGAAIEVELWSLPPALYGEFIQTVAPPLAIGPVRLAGSRVVPGFVLARESDQQMGQEITAHRGWRAYLAASRPFGDKSIDR